MAVAKLILTPVPTPPPAGVELTLTLAEANFLWALMGRIAGDPETTARRYADAIGDALDYALDLHRLPYEALDAMAEGTVRMVRDCK
jgi:hypothetical protein